MKDTQLLNNPSNLSNSKTATKLEALTSSDWKGKLGTTAQGPGYGTRSGPVGSPPKDHLYIEEKKKEPG